MTASLTDTRSAELYARAVERLPGGVNSPVRAMQAIGRTPIFIDRGVGAELFDVDDYGLSSVVGGGAVPVELEDKARLAIANCPEYAIEELPD